MRTVRLSPEAEVFVDQARLEHARFDDLWIGFEWYVAHAPQDGDRASPGWYVWKTWDWPIDGVPVIIVAYRFDHQYVDIEFIHYAEEK